MTEVKRKDAEKVFVDPRNWAQVFANLPYGSIPRIAEIVDLDPSLVRRELTVVNKKGMYRADIVDAIKAIIQEQKTSILVLEGIIS